MGCTPDKAFKMGPGCTPCGSVQCEIMDDDFEGGTLAKWDIVSGTNEVDTTYVGYYRLKQTGANCLVTSKATDNGDHTVHFQIPYFPVGAEVRAIIKYNSPTDYMYAFARRFDAYCGYMGIGTASGGEIVTKHFFSEAQFNGLQLNACYTDGKLIATLYGFEAHAVVADNSGTKCGVYSDSSSHTLIDDVVFDRVKRADAPSCGECAAQNPSCEIFNVNPTHDMRCLMVAVEGSLPAWDYNDKRYLYDADAKTRVDYIDDNTFNRMLAVGVTLANGQKARFWMCANDDLTAGLWLEYEKDGATGRAYLRLGDGATTLGEREITSAPSSPSITICQDEDFLGVKLGQNDWIEVRHAPVSGEWAGWEITGADAGHKIEMRFARYLRVPTSTNPMPCEDCKICYVNDGGGQTRLPCYLVGSIAWNDSDSCGSNLCTDADGDYAFRWLDVDQEFAEYSGSEYDLCAYPCGCAVAKDYGDDVGWWFYIAACSNNANQPDPFHWDKYALWKLQISSPSDIWNFNNTQIPVNPDLEYGSDYYNCDAALADMRITSNE